MQIKINYVISEKFQKKQLQNKKDGNIKNVATFSDYSCSQFSAVYLAEIINSKFSNIDEKGNISISFSFPFNYLILSESDIILSLQDAEKEEQKKESANAKKEEKRIEKEKNEKEKSEKFNTDMECWIEKYGSAYLKNCMKLNISCRRSYRESRLYEYVASISEKLDPKYPSLYDYLDDSDYDFSEKANPTEKWLEILIELQKTFPSDIHLEIVWIDSENIDDYDNPVNEEAFHLTADWSNFGYLIWRR